MILASTAEPWFSVSSTPDCFCGPGRCILRVAVVSWGKGRP